MHELNPKEDDTIRKSTRREYMKVAGTASTLAIGSFAGCLGGIAGGGGGKPTIKIAASNAYAKFKKPVEEAVGVDIQVKSSSDYAKIFSSWNAGQSAQFDIAVPNQNYAAKFINADLVTPINKDAVSNFTNLYSRFKDYSSQQLSKNNEVYGVPIRFGWYTYSYNSNKIPESHNQTYEQLFNDKWAGKILMDDNFIHCIVVAALVEGYKDALLGDKFSLSSKQLDVVTQRLRNQSKILAGYISSDSRYIKSMRNGNFWLGQSGRNEIIDMKRDGDDWVRLANPKEPEFTWYEAAVVSKKSDHKQKAWEVINQYISKDIGGEFAKSDSTPSCNPKAMEPLPDDLQKIISVSPSRLDGMIPFKQISNEDAWVEAWNKVKST